MVEDHQRPSAMAQLRNNFVTGIVVIGPLAITIFLARWFLEWVDSTVKPLIPAAWNPDSYLPFAVPGFGLMVALIGITMLGAMTASLIGRSLISYGEQLVDRTPFVRPVYKTIKQVFETVISNRANSFSQAGLIEWPRKGLWSIVFLSAPARGEIADKLGPDEDYVTVFIPTTPNPTGGYIMFVPRRDVRILDMSVEDAAKLVISAGLVMPEERARLTEAGTARVVDPVL
ncbi:DUF502 domain-containing protein [Prosthecomicrobium sp. N25]|uniref:DUF502 domain-containing protein n=1 Tax=Prosthecomicrobium sp. N25 TaxID=3129254 RepID=UPI0030770EF7